jgi:5-methylcytosine-specific restriction endonuclease McrA
MTCGIISPVTVMRARFVFSVTSRLSVRASHDCDKHEKRQVGGFLHGENMKRCKGCGRLRAYEEMVKDNRKPDGMGYICLECRADARQVLNSDPKRRNKKQEQEREFYKNNRERRRQASKDRYYAKHDQIRRQVQEWYESFSHVVKSRVSQWRKMNPEKKRINDRNRRDRKRSGGGTVTLKEWNDLKGKYNYTCLCCLRREPEIELTLDHVVALADGGKHVIENAQPLCGSCNSKKGKKNIDYRIKFQGCLSIADELGCTAK